MANLINVLILLLVNLIELRIAHPVPVPDKQEPRSPFLTNVELSALLTCVPGSKFKTISSFLNFNTEATCDDVSLLNSDTSANGTINFERVQIPFSALSPYSSRQIRNGFFPDKKKDNKKDNTYSPTDPPQGLRDQEVNGTINYGRCAGDNMLSEHVALGDAGSCSLERKVDRLSTIFSVIRIRGKCQSFCTGLTTIRLSPNISRI